MFEKKKMGIPAKAPKEKVKSAITAAKSLLDLLISTATILQTMRNDGNVLVAVDTAGRMLELAQLMVCVYLLI